jgi:hypothetical protein
MRRLLCKDCGHLWEVLEEEIKQKSIEASRSSRVPAELKDYFVELMEQTIDDIERSIELEKAGWCTFNPEITKLLIKTGFCEMGDEGIRLILSKPLPKELAWTDAGDIISDIQKAIELTQSLSKLSADQNLRRGAEFAGLVRMLQTSDFPVLAYVLFDKGLNPDIWFTKAPESAYELSSSLVGKLWGINEIEKYLQMLALSNFPLPEKQSSDIFEKVKKILTWDAVPKVYGSEVIEALGFAWYADRLIVAKKIKYPEGIQMVQEKVSDILENITGRNVQELADELLAATIEMEGKFLTIGEHESQIADWHDIIRFP